VERRPLAREDWSSGDEALLISLHLLLFRPKRLGVAVGDADRPPENERLPPAECGTPAQMRMVYGFCRLRELVV
jgi:hypothetical protein